MSSRARAARTAASGRAAAITAIADALRGRQFVHESLRGADHGLLETRDAALAAQIALGAVRHAITLEHVLARVARYRRERTPVLTRAALLAGAYQIIWLDRIPVFAAVDDTVEQVRALVGGRAPAMANAVLRRLGDAVADRSARWSAADGACVRTGWDRGCRFSRAVLPDAGVDADAHIAAAAGETAERFEVLRRRFGRERAALVAWASQAPPPTVLQRNALRASPEAFRGAVAEQCPLALVANDDAAFAAPGVSVVDTAMFRDGLAYVQDATARAAAEAVAAKAGERILDLCAAPGGKSIAMAIAMGDVGEVLACDTDRARLARVASNVERLGLRCVRPRLLREVSGAAASDEQAGADGTFDAALVDAPCSNTGVIARRPEARLGLTPRKLRSLVALQHDLLRRAAAAVRVGGRLVYSTCSIEPEENEEVVGQFRAEHGGFRLEYQHSTHPAWGASAGEWRDGGHVARLRRLF